MSKRVALSAALVALFVMSGCSRAGFASMTYSPRYRSSNEGFPEPPACAALSTIRVVDPRADPTLVGVRFEEDAPSQKGKIRFEGTTAERYIQGAAQKMLTRARLPLQRAGAPGLVLKITTVEIEEQVAWNAEFDAQVNFDVTVSDASGAACWTGSVEGFAENYGKSENPENYDETLNHALDRAVGSLLNDTGFLDAACGKCSAVPAPAPSAL